eukprot:TRINITY_DN24173_c0_g2_i1.p2 TRINITY_DN24173_c0_g2~~TRINITY_DN24173_c0_g2_i1.p2  ORF type:complete len:337 (-),score=61.40 TRINITY_DN24173_c0_g2_i1:1859-2869(-)
MAVVTARGQCGGGQSVKFSQAWKLNLIQNLYSKVVFIGGLQKNVSDYKPRKDQSILKLKRRNNDVTVKCQGEESFSCYPFEEKDYIKVQLKLYMEQQDTRDRYAQGNLILTREGEDVAGGVTALIMQVGGDTLSCLNSAIQRNFGDRPMALDLLYSVLERGKEISSNHWGVLRVAVVELKSNVFHGRLFFGDTRTGKAMWDCDCRPSDGSWIAIKYNVPIYVHKQVWKECARQLSFNQSPEKKLDGSGLEENIDPNDPFQVRTSDFEVIKLLKREMQVALNEENYAEAARIRDHPFLLIYMRMLESQNEGRVENANKLRKQLEEMISESEKRRVED